MDLDPEFVSDQHIIEYVNKQACYESDVAWVLMRALRSGDNAVDVGACVGFFTLLMGELVGAEGRVAAVEPGADNLPRLKRNLALNSWIPGAAGSSMPVTIVEQPLTARSEPVMFFHNYDSSGGHAMWLPELWHENIKTQAAVKTQSRGKQMQATTLNRICPSPCRLIKIDTEGAEERILLGALEVLKQHPPFIVAEMNAFGLHQMGGSPETLRAYMRLCGYDTFALYADGAMPELVPPRRGVECDHIWNVLFSTPEDVASIWQ